MSYDSDNSDNDDGFVFKLGDLKPYEIAAFSHYESLRDGEGLESQQIPALQPSIDSVRKLYPVDPDGNLSKEIPQVIQWVTNIKRREKLVEKNPYYSFAELVASQAAFNSVDVFLNPEQTWPGEDENETSKSPSPTSPPQKALAKIVQTPLGGGFMNFNPTFRGNVQLSYTDLQARANRVKMLQLSSSIQVPSMIAIIEDINSDLRNQFARLVAINIMQARMRAAREIRLQVDFDRIAAEKKVILDELVLLCKKEVNISKNKNYNNW